jgi:hypothetical protein
MEKGWRLHCCANPEWMMAGQNGFVCLLFCLPQPCGPAIHQKPPIGGPFLSKLTSFFFEKFFNLAAGKITPQNRM